MVQHTACGLNMSQLDIIVVDDAKPMQIILRSMLSAMKVKRIRVFDRADQAMQAMLIEPPNLVITDLKMDPISGFQLIRMIRKKHMAPLCFVPIIVVTAHGTRSTIERLFESGCHFCVAKPVAPANLQERLSWIIKDKREFVLKEDGYIIGGVTEQLADQQKKWEMLEKAREFHERTLRVASSNQDKIDEIIGGGKSVNDAAASLPEQMEHQHPVRKQVAAPRHKPTAVSRARRQGRRAGFGEITPH